MSEPRLEQRLSDLNRLSCEQIPTPQLAVLRRAVTRLRRSGILERCLQPGETAPDFSFIDHENRSRTLYQLCEKGPVVVNFFRGFWCGFCRSELSAYEEHVTALEEMGVSYVTVSPHVQQEQTSTAYPSVCDCDSEIARSFRILYELLPEEQALFSDWGIPLDEINRCCRWELPLPALYVIGEDRTVLFHFVDADYRQRLAPEELIAQLRLMFERSGAARRKGGD